MLGTLIALLATPCEAATLEVALKDRVGTFHAPGGFDVSLSFVGGPTGAVVEGKWDNIESNSIAVVCGTTGSRPEDDNVEQVVLVVGSDKWTLAPGSSVHFTCAAGTKAIVTDLHGTTIGTFPAQVTATVIKAKSRATR